MNLRIVILSFILVMLLSISACSANSSPGGSAKAPNEKEKTVSSEQDHSENNGLSYKIIDEIYTEDGIKLVYPQLTNASNPVKSDSINQAIQRDIRLYLEDLKDAAKDSGKLSLDIKYKMNSCQGKTISIAYTGVSTIKGAVYPVNIYHTQNIETKNCDFLPLNTLFSINSFLAKQFIGGMYLPYSDDLDLEASGINIKDELEKLYSNEDLINLFKNDSTDYYLADQGVIISVEVPHALGDHLEMAINYESIESNIIKDNPMWKD